MICPNCHSQNDNNAKLCSSCGADLTAGNGSLKAATNTGLVLGKAARAARLQEAVDPDAIISDRAYNGTMVGVLLWGLLINVLLCWKVGSVYNAFPNMSPLAFLIGYLVLAFAGIFTTVKAKSPLIAFLGYNLVVIPFGLVISTLVEAYGGIGSNVVTLAFLYTLLVTVGITATVIMFPNLFAKLGGVLGGVLIGLILCEIVLAIARVQQIWTCWLAAGLFSVYLGYDIYRSQQYPKTVKNAVMSALDIYLDLANLFIRILEILGKKDD